MNTRELFEESNMYCTQNSTDSVVIQDLDRRLREAIYLLDEWSKVSREKSYIQSIDLVDLAVRTDRAVNTWKEL
jgi:hypothetical protein